MEILAIPELRVPFELRLSDTVNPLVMVQNDGYDNWSRWTYLGARINGVQIRRFMLIKIGPTISLKEAREITEQFQAKTPSGLIREPFKESFPVPDGHGPIVIADDSWLDPKKKRNFPFFYARDNQQAWKSGFRDSLAALSDLHGGCRLLVQLV